MTSLTFPSPGTNTATRQIPFSGIILLETGDQLDNEDGTNDSFEVEGFLSVVVFDFTFDPPINSLTLQPAQNNRVNATSDFTGILTQQTGFDIDNEDGSGDSILLEGTQTFSTLELTLANRTRALESPITLIEGTKKVYSTTFQNAGDLTSPSVDVFIDGQTASYKATAMPSGNPTASGNVVTLPELIAVDGDGGKSYSVVVTAVDGADTDVRKFVIDIEKKELL